MVLTIGASKMAIQYRKMINLQLNGLYDHIKESGNKNCHRLASFFKTSSSSIFRKLKQLKSRSHICGASFFETQEGQAWLIKLIVAIIMIFGVLCGIGGERLSLFFSLLELTYFVGLSERSINRVTQKIEELIEQYGAKQDTDVKAQLNGSDVILGVDETFFDNLMILVGMELKSGFIFCEESATDRTHKTWETKTKSWFECFGNVVGLVSDRAKALIKLAKDTLKKPSFPDLFHAIHELSKTVGKEIGQKLSRAETALRDAKEKGLHALSKHFETQKIRLEEGQTSYQTQLQQFSIALHPFAETGAKQTTETVNQKLDLSLESIETISDEMALKLAKKSIPKVRDQTQDMAKQIDIWWQIVESSLDGSDLSFEQKCWLMYCYLPCIYWQKQIPKTKSQVIKSAYEKSYQLSLLKLQQHLMTQVMTEQSSEKLWQNWAKEMTDLFQRTSSAVEGRNGWLSQMYFCGRGMTIKRLKSQTVLHNYFLKRSDGTTACERLTGTKPSCMFEYIIKNIGELPQPRKRAKKLEVEERYMW